jgi:hypothetical protein
MDSAVCLNSGHCPLSATELKRNGAWWREGCTP